MYIPPEKPKTLYMFLTFYCLIVFSSKARASKYLDLQKSHSTTNYIAVLYAYLHKYLQLICLHIVMLKGEKTNTFSYAIQPPISLFGYPDLPFGHKIFHRILHKGNRCKIHQKLQCTMYNFMYKTN